jgi:enoyl-CoA hydratase/carnithine racemase
MSDISYWVDGPIAHVRLNRPRSLNAINGVMDVALRDAWNAINADPTVRVVSLTAEGERAFCVGADINEHPRGGERIALGGGITGIGGPLLTVTKPIVAAVQGHVLGGGFELAMCADIIVAADTTSFGLPETLVGFIGECGVVHRAMRQLPYRVALGMILTGNRLSASDALQHGLVNEVVDFTGLGAAVTGWCDRLLAASPLAVQAAKEAALSRLDQPLPLALSSRFEAIEHYAETRDRAESQAAFREKRAPHWEGR